MIAVDPKLTEIQKGFNSVWRLKIKTDAVTIADKTLKNTVFKFIHCGQAQSQIHYDEQLKVDDSDLDILNEDEDHTYTVPQIGSIMIKILKQRIEEHINEENKDDNKDDSKKKLDTLSVNAKQNISLIKSKKQFL